MTERSSGPRPARSPVLADVAADAGVSHQTVSRVVNGHPHVAPQTRERVEASIAALGYRPNAAARTLVTRRTHRIGVVTTASSHYGPAATLRGIEAEARSAGFAVSVTILGDADDDPGGATGPDDPARQRGGGDPDRLRAGLSEALEHLAAEPVDGIVAIAPEDAAQRALPVRPPAVPLVQVAWDGGEEDGTELGAVADQVAGARAAVAHLLGLGHGTVHHVAGPPDWREARAREAGWREALTGAGVETPAPEVGDWMPASGHAAAVRLLARGGAVSSIFVANDQMALGVVRALVEAGLDVPGDVSVVGFDDQPEAAYFSPPLTTVRLDLAGRGRRSVRDLLARLGVPPPSPGPVAAAPQLVVRASTARPRP